MRIKKKDLRRGLAQRPINYPAPTIEEQFDYEVEKQKVENMCRRLANNEVEVRDAVLAELPKYLKEVTSTFLEEETKMKKKAKTDASASIVVGGGAPTQADDDLEMLFMKLAYGIYYCYWHSDKPLVQHDCAHRIALLVHCPSTNLTKCLLVRCILRLLCREWAKLDRYRIDKYMSLVRKIFFQILLFVKSTAVNVPTGSDEALQLCDEASYAHLVATFHELVTDSAGSIGLLMHLCDICLDEFTRADLPDWLFTRLAKDIPLYAMSRGNFVEKRVLDFFVAPLACRVMRPKEEAEEAEAAADPSKPAKHKWAKKTATDAEKNAARDAALLKERSILRSMKDVCRAYSVAKGTVRVVRVMFTEAEGLLGSAVEMMDEPELRVKTTLRGKKLAIRQELDEADDNRINVVLGRRDGRLLRKQEKQSKTTQRENDDDGAGVFDEDDDEKPRKKSRMESSAAAPKKKKSSLDASSTKSATAKKSAAVSQKKKSSNASSVAAGVGIKKESKVPLKGVNIKRITKRRKEYIMSRQDYDGSDDEK